MFGSEFAGRLADSADPDQTALYEQKEPDFSKWDNLGLIIYVTSLEKVC